jgi:SAM-dependent methyltransferase
MNQMDYDEKTLWNQRYAEGSHVSMEPDPFLLSAYSEFLDETSPGYALDLAGGVGRHSLWLAEHGWRVKLIDISGVGVTMAQENFQQPQRVGVTGGAQPLSAALAEQFETQIVDLSQIRDLGQEQYNLILVFFYLQRSLFPALISALRPEGFLIYKTYTTESTRLGHGPSHPMYLLQPNELLRAFQSLRILHYHETMKEKGVAELVAQKSNTDRGSRG